MSRVRSFFVLSRPAGPAEPWPAGAILADLPADSSGSWQVLAASRLLVGWLGDSPPLPDGAREPFVVWAGDLARPDARTAASPAVAADLASGRVDVAGSFDGAFAALAVDPGAEAVALVTDRFGLFPLYEHATADGCHGYATSLSILKAVSRPAAEPDPRSLTLSRARGAGGRWPRR